MNIAYLSWDLPLCGRAYCVRVELLILVSVPQSSVALTLVWRMLFECPSRWLPPKSLDECLVLARAL
jgi:hypothetical protein